MPRKRNPNTFLINKQKKIITSRLMQISLKVDDYVYKHKPISAKSAAMFIKEVTGYKNKCFDDMRTLQVIEKLHRCMKGIIEEQEQLHPSATNDVTLADIDTILAASTDDDLTQLTQEIDVNNMLASTNNNTEVIDLDDERLNINNDLNDNGKEQVGLSINEKDKTSDKGHLNYNLQRAISNLSIRGEDDPLSTEPFNFENCSQSILNNFESYNFEEAIQSPTITKESRIVKAVTNVELTPIIQTSSKTTLNSSYIPLNMTESRTEKDNKANKIITKEKVVKKRARKASPKREKGNEIRNKPAPKRNNKQTMIDTVTQNEVMTKSTEKKFNTAQKLFKDHEANKANEPDPNRKWNKDSNQHKNMDEMQSNQKLLNENTTYNPIYNKDVENDLSWVENIRYVREINQEEYTPAYFEDGFWENYTLPNYWNNDDFLYT